ncbi:MAG: chemotaxis protein [Lachnospiraceae bacterium]|nr:chemotaxis protein [Lachnospiraceae bacterium]
MFKKKPDTAKEDLQKLLEYMKAAAQGDMSAAEASAFHDSEVADCYNEMLKSFFKANNVFVMRMNDAMKEIGDSSVVKNMIEEVNEQTGIVGTIHASGQELEKSITNVQNAVSNIQISSHDVIKTTQDCSEEITQSIAVIDSTADEVTQINKQIATFKENTEKITRIIDQIKDLADNSSLLALNASIEAARAGESGKGFAVVAQQMGVQAGDTAACADAVVSYVDELLENIDAIAESVEVTSAHLKDGTNSANHSVRSLDEMVNQVSGINEDINAIFEEVNTQSALTEEFIALGNTVASGFDRLNDECFTTGEHLYKISRSVDNVRSDMARSRSELTMLDWITVFEVDHLIFTWRQYNNLVGFEHLKIEQVNNPRGCKLGKWFAGVQDDRIRKLAAFNEAFGLHDELHQHAVNCFNAAAEGQRERALQHFDSAYESYGKLCTALDSLRDGLKSLGYTDVTDITRKK